MDLVWVVWCLGGLVFAYSWCLFWMTCFVVLFICLDWFICLFRICWFVMCGCVLLLMLLVVLFGLFARCCLDVCVGYMLYCLLIWVGFSLLCWYYCLLDLFRFASFVYIMVAGCVSVLLLVWCLGSGNSVACILMWHWDVD